MQTTHMVINSLPVSITYSIVDGPPDKTNHRDELGRFWKGDKVSIFNHHKGHHVKEEEIETIMGYLYSEGFILDRRTECEVIVVES